MEEKQSSNIGASWLQETRKNSRNSFRTALLSVISKRVISKRNRELPSLAFSERKRHDMATKLLLASVPLLRTASKLTDKLSLKDRIQNCSHLHSPYFNRAVSSYLWLTYMYYLVCLWRTKLKSDSVDVTRTEVCCRGASNGTVKIEGR